ncbi:MAG: DUF1203 domain-containing protein [Bacteroidota bacterium]|jgi:hypothetical protein
MLSFRIVPLSEEFAEQIRRTRKDQFDIDVVEHLATGYGPCRVTLTPFEPGRDIRLLFRHSPFTVNNAFDQPGPVFIHKKEVKAYSDIHRFPPEIKNDPVNFPLTLIGYSQEQRMVHTQLVGNNDVDELIPYIFSANSRIEYLHVRNAEAGCYICRIERN